MFNQIGIKMKPSDLNSEQQISAESALKKTTSQSNFDSDATFSETESESFDLTADSEFMPDLADFYPPTSNFSVTNPLRERLKSKPNKTVSEISSPESVTSATTFVTPPEITEAMSNDVVQEVEKSPEQATQAAHEAIKIDNGRATIFSQAATLINEGKTQELGEFLKSSEAVEMTAKDTSFNQFSAIATPITSAGEDVARPQDKQELLGKLSEIFGYLGQEVDDVENKEVESTKWLDAAQKIHQEPRFEKLVVKKESIIPAPEEQIQVEEADKSAALDPNADFNTKVEEEAKKEEEAKAKGRKREITDANVKDVAIGVGATALAITACVMMPPFGIFVAGAIMYAASTQMSSKEKDGERDVNLSEIEDLDLVKISDRFQVAPAATANQTEAFVDEVEEDLKDVNAKLNATNVALHKASGEKVEELELTSAPIPTIIAPQVEEVLEGAEEEVKQSSSAILTPQAPAAAEAEAAEVVVENQPQIAAVTEERLDSSQKEELGKIINSLKSSTTRHAEGVSDTNAHLPEVTIGQNRLGL